MLIFNNGASALSSIVAISWIWSSQLRFSPILTPRYFTELEGYGLFLLKMILIGYSSFFFFRLKITTSVFFKLSAILLAFSQSLKFFISRLIYLLSFFTDLLKWSRFKSTAKWWTLQNFKPRFRSLTYIKNKSGTRTEPWGIPYFTELW